MTPSMVVIAYYDDVKLANQAADMLQAEGVPSVVEVSQYSPPEDMDDSLFSFPMPPVELWVHVEDEPKASMIIDRFDVDSLFSQSASKSEEYTLIGTVLALVGFLATWGSYGEVPNAYLLFPLAMLACGIGVLAYGRWERPEEL